MLHARNFRNEAGRSFTNLTGTTISEYPELWNQLCRLQLPSKILWRILLNFLLVRVELRNIWVLSPLSQRFFFFPFHLEKSGLVWSIHWTDFIQLYLISFSSYCLFSPFYGLFGLIETRQLWRNSLLLPLMWSCIVKVWFQCAG